MTAATLAGQAAIVFNSERVRIVEARARIVLERLQRLFREHGAEFVLQSQQQVHHVLHRVADVVLAVELLRRQTRAELDVELRLDDGFPVHIGGTAVAEDEIEVRQHLSLADLLVDGWRFNAAQSSANEHLGHARGHLYEHQVVELGVLC